eukprot:2883352-Amphidinium_carterae.1
MPEPPHDWKSDNQLRSNLSKSLRAIKSNHTKTANHVHTKLTVYRFLSDWISSRSHYSGPQKPLKR